VNPVGGRRPDVIGVCFRKQARAILGAMISPAPRHRYSFKEYLDLEDFSVVRHEFYDGEIYAIAGGTPEHAAMAAAVIGLLARQIHPGVCRVYSSDLRVRVLATGLATYPDAAVICGPSERDPESATHVTNPKLIVEILSSGTEAYDRGEKLLHYQQIPSLDAVVLIDHASERVDLWTRAAGIWQSRTFGAGDRVPLDAVGAILPVDEIYSAARNA
jgi:Uma2 family endonuclease